ncbi:hypothetical protein L195_g038465 [Trifolium pratense]|uniref:Uncharacterized protein n=1 Tax=Trifolium pratense TaxID=57577 RepID=A0A2K3LV74_TRIPR|nr:hypothetical protein L195_g038465 [Trifolium pratense]
MTEPNHVEAAAEQPNVITNIHDQGIIPFQNYTLFYSCENSQSRDDEVVCGEEWRKDAAVVMTASGGEGKMKR